MRISIVRVPAAHDGDVRLWGRFIVQRQWILDADDPPRWQRCAERIARHPDARRMRAALRLRDDELSADELDRLAVLERADVDQPLIFDAAPTLRGEWRLLHGG